MSLTYHAWWSQILQKERFKFSICQANSRGHVIREPSDIMGKFSSSWVTTFKRLVAISLAEEEIFYFWFVTCPHVTTRSEVMWHWWVSLNISLHGHKRCSREEISPFVFHVTSRDVVVRESCDIMSEFPSSLVTTLQNLVIIGLLEEKILYFQFVTWLHVTTWS